MESDLLQQLRDIHLPDAPEFWPPAPGWWLLAALLVALLAWLVWRCWRRWQHYAPAREAARLYRALHQQTVAGDCTTLEFLHRTNELMKRLAIHGIGDGATRRLAGDAWLEWIEGRMAGPGFDEASRAALSRGRFAGDDWQPDEDTVDRLHQTARRFFAAERRRFWWSPPAPAEGVVT